MLAPTLATKHRQHQARALKWQAVRLLRRSSPIDGGVPNGRTSVTFSACAESTERPPARRVDRGAGGVHRKADSNRDGLGDLLQALQARALAARHVERLGMAPMRWRHV